MHNAPSVTYPVGRSHSAAVLLLLVWLLAAGATALWWAQIQVPGWRLGAAGLLLVLTGLSAFCNWWRTPSGALAWNGESWSWASHGQPGSAPEVALDLQRWLLLRWRCGGATRWLWLERARGAERWDDLRRAVYSRARAEVLPGAQPASKK